MEIFNYFNQFCRLSNESELALKKLLRTQSFAKNELIQKPDNSCRTIYFIQQGLARIFYYKNGNDITEHFAFENNIVVRAESLFTGNPTPKGIQAIEPTRCIMINAAQLFELYDTHHDIERLFRLIFEREHVNTLKRMESLQIKTATERYLELLNETNYIQHIPLKYIASYLGITQVSLSRIRASLH